MLLPDHEFLKPASLAEGLALLAARPEARVLAGGTDVVFNMRGRLFTPPSVVSVRGLPELQGVHERPDGSLDIGAGCRLTDLLADPRVARQPALLAALRAVASRHVRNLATLGGNLCLDTRCWFTNQSEDWRAARGPCLKTGVDACHALHGSPVCVALNNADTPPALIALDATVTLESVRGRRQVALRDFYRDDGIAHTVRAPDELLTRVVVPPTTDRVVFLKETARQGMDFAYGTIAARAEGHGARAGRLMLVLGSLTTAPVVLDDIAARLVADGLGDDAIDAACAGLRAVLGPLTNLYTPAAYKRELARALLRRALLALREM
jgi:4-hydroxybenzoyl-CoA reductase subunit beta